MNTTDLFSVKAEHTNWRDEEISKRHRAWGFNCPAVDLDFLMVEYNFGKPIGIVEYKHANAFLPFTQDAFSRYTHHATYRALADLCNGYRSKGLPFLIVRYYPHNWSFIIYPVNECARAHFKYAEPLSEFEFVQRLYRLRRLTVSQELLGRLNQSLPPI